MANFIAAGNSIGAAHEVYENTFKQLANGRGIFSKKVERLKEMGAKIIKSIPIDYWNEE